MESLLILAAVAATLLALVLVVGLSKGSRRAPLRLPREEEWADNTEAMVRALTPDRPSPIDRAAPVLDAAPVEDRPAPPSGSGRPGRS